MSIIIIGCGRSGTSMAVEILAIAKELIPSKKIDTKDLFNKKKWPKNFLTKGPTPPHFKYSMLKKLMESDKNMKIIWTIRDPRDILISKMRRGIPESEGGDCLDYIYDGTIEGAINNIYIMFEMYKKVKKDFPNRVYLLRMENIIIDFENTVKKLCKFVNVKYKDEMKYFYKTMRNKHKRKRYHKIDKKEIFKWKNWKTIYQGFFVKNKINLNSAFLALEPVIKYFKYDSNCPYNDVLNKQTQINNNIKRIYNLINVKSYDFNIFKSRLLYYINKYPILDNLKFIIKVIIDKRFHFTEKFIKILHIFKF